ncbi:MULTISPECIES: DUF4235 domain-containing protein [unclassified Streptomyces]|uniref:DUF4235 domain-containing protein n=1 Tax=unclassified Streptomyces TaxID=2593676 RepID=UPI001BE88EFE|nr:MULTISPECIES: DUF4235 domain-containing protein [unclassified Streptomyces]MBT2407609.1 DUF4235 domain-containing protein [Streptomyces sp. ISL-21]MBT2459083.1 DUF4235 domain-containing protein [Streptomyces sp. ISL-86]MBT2611603.1 DUF4235 domain-containing protein [Streptomyces sp. ISL-87]
MKASKLAYKPVGLALGAGAGMVAGSLFKQVWKLVGHEGDAPNATDEERRWGEILIAAAVQGAIFALVKAAVERSGAVAVRRLSGTWPA